MEKNYFIELNSVNVSDYIEKKNGLSYVSWANAWAEVKKRFPDATYTIYENEVGWNYHTDGKTCWVKTGVTVNGIEHIEYLPVMDFKNKSIPVENITSFDVNKTIQRSLTKAVARHGLGLYVYAGEDLPESDPQRQAEEQAKNQPITDIHIKAIRARIEKLDGLTEEKVLKKYNLNSLEEMPMSMLMTCNKDLNDFETALKKKKEA